MKFPKHRIELEKLVDTYRTAVVTHVKVAADDDLDDKWQARETAAKAALLALYDNLRLEFQGLQKASELVASAIRNLEGQPIQYSLAKDLSSALAKLEIFI